MGGIAGRDLFGLVTLGLRNGALASRSNPGWSLFTAST
jgi:hypothetical protein